MEPIFNGAFGATILGFVIALGAYLRATYAANIERHDRLLAEHDKKLWPLSAQYTQDRIQNLKYVGKWLARVSQALFIFMFFILARLMAYAINAVPSLKCIHSDATPLSKIDLILMGVLSLILLVGYLLHLKTSAKERAYHDAACMALRIKQSENSD